MSVHRDYSIDILKFLAAILITNSHIKIFEPDYILSTGGTLGDVMFIFCSGFTLFLGKTGRFDNWYKKRLMRIFPPVVCWGVLAAFIFNSHASLKDVIINGGGWFVQCILIYYIVGYFINRYAIRHLIAVFVVCLLITIIWFSYLDKGPGFNIYGWNYCKWCLFFLFFIFGAKMGRNRFLKKSSYSLTLLLSVLVVSVVMWYGILWIQNMYLLTSYIQLLTIIPLISFIWAAYKSLNVKIVSNFFSRPIVYRLYHSIGGLCYEIYLVQFTVFKNISLKIEYPLNIVIILVIIWGCAYLLHVFTSLCMQTFSIGNYNWRDIFKI